VNGLLSCRLSPIFIIIILWKLVMSIKVVGRVLRLLFHPGKSRFSLSTYCRISLSIKRHISSESKRSQELLCVPAASKIYCLRLQGL
jgi:hypothetical protein